MKGEKVISKAYSPLHRTLILLIITILILSSVPVAVASSAIPMLNSENIQNCELKTEKPFNRLFSEMPLPLDNQVNTPPSSILIKMKADEFDPLVEEPNFPPDLLYNIENGYYLVQFNGPIQFHWTEKIREAGALVLGYVPDHTYLIFMDHKTKQNLEKFSFVRWIGIYHPAYKIQDKLLNKTQEIELNVLVFEDKQDNLAKVRVSIKKKFN